VKHYIISEAQLHNLPVDVYLPLRSLTELKRLSDEEIKSILYNDAEVEGLVDFAKAIMDKLGVPE